MDRVDRAAVSISVTDSLRGRSTTGGQGRGGRTGRGPSAG
jgi:hypothetical protein